MNIPHSTTVYLNKAQNDKLKTISFEMKLNKDSLVNFWLSRGLKHNNPSEFTQHDLYLNSFSLLNEIKSELQRISYTNNMQLSHIASSYLKDAIDTTHEFLNLPLHTANFQKLVHHFEDNTEISKWPNVGFRNKRYFPEEVKTNKKIYLLINRSEDGREDIAGVYTSLEQVEKQLKDLQRGKEIHHYYGYHIDSYHENGGMDKCCFDVKDK